jgi:hypothetical protein
MKSCLTRRDNRLTDPDFVALQQGGTPDAGTRWTHGRNDAVAAADSLQLQD